MCRKRDAATKWFERWKYIKIKLSKAFKRNTSMWNSVNEIHLQSKTIKYNREKERTSENSDMPVGSHQY